MRRIIPSRFMGLICTPVLAAIAAGAVMSAASPAQAKWKPRHYWAGAATFGAVAGAAAVYGHAHPGWKYAEPDHDCWSEHRPVFNRFGEQIGTRRIRVCN